ncbi:hypothetical protein Nepgr_021059 [Nepenthes gracilis]|uniref:Uncharacterized protein n=1 Tax=Nepenthes gracilis TaxID=150966 RepID=A0AAD3SW78_NEPGR|nr:hypothetical protein Nepgr_021059 [Nepenthes gracilis]
MLVVLLVIADPARMSLGSWWLNCYVNLLTAAEMVQCHILAAGIVLDDLVTGSYWLKLVALPFLLPLMAATAPVLRSRVKGSCWLAEVELEVVAALMKMEYAVASAFMLPFAHM